MEKTQRGVGPTGPCGGRLRPVTLSVLQGIHLLARHPPASARILGTEPPPILDPYLGTSAAGRRSRHESPQRVSPHKREF